jgi:hypothetical protein
MKQLMPFVVALISVTGATLHASAHPKLAVDQHVLAGRQISGEQLEQMLAVARHESDIELAGQLSGLELTERLSADRLARCAANLPGPNARRALRALAIGHHSLILQHPRFLPLPSQIQKPSVG